MTRTKLTCVVKLGLCTSVLAAFINAHFAPCVKTQWAGVLCTMEGRGLGFVCFQELIHVVVFLQRSTIITGQTGRTQRKRTEKRTAAGCLHGQQMNPRRLIIQHL